MKLREFIALFDEEDMDREVLVSTDNEGNGYRKFSGYGINSYDDSNQYNLEIGLEELTPELKKQGYSEEDVLEGKPCIVLY